MVGHTGGPHRATRKMSFENTSGGASNRADNKSSQLLTKDENDQIFRLLGHKCQTLATAVVQLYTSEPPQHVSWVYRDTGVLCLVKDNVRRSYFFRLFCLQRSSMVWEHEVYNHIEYRSPRQFLHTFEAEDCVAAFNFASEREAYSLRATLLEKMEAKKQRKMERRSRQSMGPPPERPQPPLINGPSQVVPVPGPKPAAQKVQRTTTKWSNKRREKDSARRLTKADIGLPQDFRHVTHVGWDPNKGFDLDNVEDPQLKQFFVKAGVSENQLNDRETREFIYDFINRHGGIEAVKEEVIQALPQAVAMHQSANQIGPPPPVPARSAPPQSESKSSMGQVRSAPPPPPSRTQAAPVTIAPAPPLPPVRTLPVPKVPTPEQVSVPAPPPPPPPPPMVPLDLPSNNQTPTPTPSITSTASSGSTDPRTALMDAIRSGKQLKRVEPTPTPSASGTMTGDTRGELLDQIRQGIELRRVVPSASSAASKQDVASQDSLAGALARALAERSRAIHSDSSSASSEDEEEDDEEWDD